MSPCPEARRGSHQSVLGAWTSERFENEAFCKASVQPSCVALSTEPAGGAGWPLGVGLATPNLRHCAKLKAAARLSLPPITKLKDWYRRACTSCPSCPPEPSPGTAKHQTGLPDFAAPRCPLKLRCTPHPWTAKRTSSGSGRGSAGCREVWLWQRLDQAQGLTGHSALDTAVALVGPLPWESPR